MAPLALPPGPFFEQLVANGLFGYTDVFNYHYYGYAEDFSDVYHQFGDAAASARNAETPTTEMRKTEPAYGEGPGRFGSNSSGFSFQDVSVSAFPAAPRPMRRVPVMLSEFGYGRLGESARDTVEGRVRQWAWFRDVALQIRKERIAAPIAFRFRSTLERGLYDFGLTRNADESLAVEGGADDGMRAAGVAFRPADFGAEEREPWMNTIGKRMGGAEASPALAWLTDYGERQRYRARDWKVRAPAASLMVIDFIADETLSQRKRYGGYLVMGGGDAAHVSGTGTVVVYNFSNETVRGRLEGPLLAARAGKAEKLKSGNADIGKPTRWTGGGEEAWPLELEMAPMARMTIPVRLELNAERFAGVRWALRFEPESRGIATADFSTVLYPSPAGMKETLVRRFDYPAEQGADARASLLTRPLAAEEPVSTEAGRWLVTEGVTVAEDTRGRWRFVVEPSADPARQRVMAELPLSDD
ncbi:MAG TPA: hypothetical protein VEA63_08825, partial [Opitutus sp.]|nr:hypothetical protein [Opitutus sp.]